MTLPWRRVYGAFPWPAAADGARREVYVLADRAASGPPWLVLPTTSLPEGLGTGDFLDAVRARVGVIGYREVEGAAARLPPDALREAVLARRPLPGALEVPPAATGARASTRRVAPAAAAGALVALLTGGTATVAVLAAAGAGALAWRVTEPTRRWPGDRRRVLVLAPAGCVLGLPGGPVALAWDEVASFETGQDGELRVTRRVDARAVTMPRRAFAYPTGLLVAVAETYRARFSGGEGA